MNEFLLWGIIMVGVVFVFLIGAVLMFIFKVGDKMDEEYKKMTPEERKKHDADTIIRMG